MLLPIGDDNPTSRDPVVNWALIAINALAFVATLGPGLQIGPWALEHLALRPDALAPHQFLTSMFMHGDPWHLLGNMIFLWICGDNIEDVLGRAWYVAFYLGCGVAADMAHLVLHIGSTVPTIGASGAVSGVLGAYVLLYPNHQIKIFYWFYFWIGVWYVSAKWAIGFWFAKEILSVVLAEGVAGGGGVAHLAHVGGFVAGAAVALALRDKLLGPVAGRAPTFGAAGRRVRDVDFGPIPDGLDAEGRPTYGTTPPPRTARGTEWTPGASGTWAVLATSEEPLDPSLAGQALAGALQRHTVDVTTALHRHPGFLARGVDEASARRALQALTRAGIAATVREESTLKALPPVVEVPRALFSADGFECDTAAGFLRVGHDDLALLVVGRVRRAPTPRFRVRRDHRPGRFGGPFSSEPALELVTEGEGRSVDVLTVFLRSGPRLLFVDGETVAKLVRPRWGVAVGLPVRGIVVRLMTHAPTTARNRGVENLTGGARQRDWVGLSFDGFAAYEAYCAWLWQVRGPR